MFHRFHDRFGTAGVVIGVIALIAALGGTALAAGGLSAKQKKEVTKIAMKYAGKPGAPGATGPAGTNGTNGKDGTNGTNGTNGKSVEVIASSGGAGEACEGPGGAEVKQEGAGSGAEVCNGEPGAIHPGETLPTGATETGAWSGPAVKFTPEGEVEQTSVSFPVPLASAPTFVYVPADPTTKEMSSDPADGCPGVSGGVPQAASGKFCVYGVGILFPPPPATPFLNQPGSTVQAFNPTSGGEVETVTPAGAVLRLTCPNGGSLHRCVDYGLWAVTG